MPVEWRRWVRCALGVVGTLAVVGAVHAAEPPRRITAAWADEAVQVDGRLDEPAWRRAASSDAFVERKPRQGGRPPVATELRVLQTAGGLVFGVTCHDPEPPTARTLGRDSFAIFEDDAISIKIDAALDRRSSFGFVLNPAGARLDYRGVNEAEFRREYDARWSGRAARFEGGWTAEFRIPWAALAVDPRRVPARMGLNLSRDHSRRNATYDWALMPPPYSPVAASLYGELVLVTPPAAARAAAPDALAPPPGFSVIPHVRMGVARRRPDASEGFVTSGEPATGLDVMTPLGAGWRGHLSLHTDFSEVDVDDRVANLGRFSLFLPEKREFFLVDFELFRFGRPGTAQLFHSRRIGLQAGRAIPVVAGLKAVGRPTRGLRVGVMEVTTQADGDTPWTSNLVARAQQELGGGSNVGGLATWRQSLDDASDYNAAIGLDAAWRGASNRLLVEGWGVGSWTGSAARGATADVGDRDGAGVPGARGGAGSLIARWRGKLWRPRLSWMGSHDDLRADLGFFRRTGGHELEAGLGVEPRIDAHGMEKVVLDTSVDAFAAGAFDDLLDWSAGGSAELRWDAGWSVTLGSRLLREEVLAPFDVGDRTTIEVGSYTMPSATLRLATPGVTAYGGSVTYGLRDYYDGAMHQVAVALRARPGAFLRFDASAAWDRARFSDARAGFDSWVVNGRASVGFSPDLGLDLFGGWSRLDERVVAQARLRWDLASGAEAFVVYQHDLADDDAAALAQSLQVKVTWRVP